MPNDNYSNTHEILDFEDLPKENYIIKVIGVGGGKKKTSLNMY